MKNNFELLLLNPAKKDLRKFDKDVRIEISKDMRYSQKHKDSLVFKKLSGDIWEFRTSYNKNIYRTLAFWDKHIKACVVATSAFQKKDQKTPKKEIDRANKIMKQYYG